MNDSVVYGSGDDLLLTLRFTASVMVHGIPTLTLNTGCHSSNCTTNAVQSFVCRADMGMFAIRFQDQFIMNIDALTNQEQLKILLETLVGVNKVSVLFGEADNRVYSGGWRVCTFLGKNVTVTFENVSFPEFNGRVPRLLFDVTNSYHDLRTGQSQGFGSNLLAGNRPGYIPSIVSNELVIGVQISDGTAYYQSGNGTDAIVFSYFPSIGESTSQLEVKGISYSSGYIYQPITGNKISQSVPYFGAGVRSLSKVASSLGFNSAIGISVKSPQILSVTSPDTNGIKSLGDVLTLYVIYDRNVRVVNSSSLVLKLATGEVQNYATYVRLLGRTTLVFTYAIKVGDSASMLDYASSASLLSSAGAGGGGIAGVGSTSSQSANTTLPFPSLPGSLSSNKNFQIDTTLPVIKEVAFVNPPGEYTAGDEIEIAVTYSFPVVVYGLPYLYVRNIPSALTARIRNIPADPSFSFKRALPGGTVQLLSIFALNWDLLSGDVIRLNLPGFYTESSGLEIVRYMTVHTGPTFTNFSKVIWTNSNQTLDFILGNFVSKYSVINIRVEGSSGLFSPKFGVTLSANYNLSYTILSKSVQNVSFSSSVQYTTISAVGLSSLSLSISPPTLDKIITNLILEFAVPEILVVGDQISLILPGFQTAQSSYSSSTMFGFPCFNYSWSTETSQFTVFVIRNTSALQYSFNLSTYVPFVLPNKGVNGSTVRVSTVSTNNGDVTYASVPLSLSVCSVYDASVLYVRAVAGMGSDVIISFTPGFPLFVGDSVELNLSPQGIVEIAAARILSEHDIDATQSTTGDSTVTLTVTVTVTVRGSAILILLHSIVPADSPISLTIRCSAGLLVPHYGVNRGDVFSVKMISVNSLCVMNDRFVPFTNFVVKPSTALASYSPFTANFREIGLFFSVVLPVEMERGEIISVYLPYFGFNSSSFYGFQSSVTSSVSFSTVYFQELKLLQFKLLQSISAFQSISVNVTKASGISVISSIPYDAFQLRISSKNGELSGQNMDTFCSGWCYAKSQFSSNYAGEYLVSTYILQFSFNLSANSEITFQFENYALNNKTIQFCDVSIMNANSTFYKNTTISISNMIENQNQYLNSNVNNSNLNVSLLLPYSINAYTLFAIKFEGIDFSTNSDTLVPKVNISAFHNSVERSISLPRSLPLFSSIQPQVKFPTSTLSFSPLLSGENSNLSFSFESNTPLRAGSYFSILLPLFDNTSIPIVSSTYMRNVSFWDPVQYVLTSILLVDISKGMIFGIYVSGLSLPLIGVDSSHGISNVGYSVGKERNSMCQFVPIKSIQEAISISGTVDFTLVLNSLNLSAILIEFSSSSLLQVGDEIVLHLPSITNIDQSSAALISPSAYNTTLFSKVTLNSSTSSLLLSLYSIPTLSFSFYVRSPVLTFSLNGALNKSYLGSISVIRSSSSEIIATKKIPVPCIGVCGAQIVPRNNKEGYPTDFLLTILLQRTFFATSDILYLSLPGFYQFEIPANNVTVSKSVGDSVNPFGVVWHRLLNVLEIKIVNITKYTPKSEISITILSTLNLALPIYGIKSDTYYDLILHSGGLNYSHTKSLATVSVGHLNYSSIQFYPQNPGVSVSANVTLVSQYGLSLGDVIEIFLSGFIIPQTQLEYRLNSNSEYKGNITVIGAENTDFKAHKIQIYLSSNLAALSPLSFFLPISNGIKSPLLGVSTDVPSVSIVSDVYPSVSTPILTYSPVGSLSPGIISILYTPRMTQQQSLKVNLMTVQFTVNCALNVGNVLSIYLPNLKGVTGGIGVQTISVNQSFDGFWNNETRTLQLSNMENINLNDVVHLVLNSSYIGVTRLLATNMIINENDGNYRYSVQSITCPIFGSRFENSSSSLVLSSSLYFSSTALVNKRVPLNFTYIPTMDSEIGDILVLILPGFTGNLTDSINYQDAIFGGNVYVHPYISGGTSGVRITATFTENYSALKSVTLFLNFSIILPENGVSAYENNITYSQIRTFGHGNTAKRNVTVLTGTIQNVQTIGYFTENSLILSNALSGHSAEIGLNWTFSGTIIADETITLFLPDFTLRFNGITASTAFPLTVDGQASLYFTAIWYPNSSNLVLTSILGSGVESVFSAFFNAGLHSFFTPVNGVSSNDEIYRISTNSVSGAVYSQILNVPIIPHFGVSSLSFLSGDADRSVEVGGDYHSVELYAGHGITEDDVDSQVTINYELHTIKSINDDILSIKEKYIGETVFLGLPKLNLFTPNSRPAIYCNGSGNATLLFKYIPRKGDESLYMSILNGSLFTGFQGSEILGGTILRAAQTALLNASREMPNIAPNRNISVNTSAPHVVSIFSTSATTSNLFSVGEKIDFQVVFSYPVVNGGQVGFNSTPILVLNIGKLGEGIGVYSHGNGTNTLIFIYTVSIYDFQLRNNGSASILSNEYSFVQPLRVQHTQQFEYLRRKSKYPLIDAIITFPVDILYHISLNMSIVGIAPKMVQKSVGPNLNNIGGAFSAGDTVPILIRYSGQVHVLGTGIPYFKIITGTGIYGIARYSTSMNSTTLLFNYVVRVGDSAAFGLHVEAGFPVSDYFGRSYIQLNGSVIVSSISRYSSLIPASNVLSESNSSDSLRIPSSPTHIIDNSPPYVINTYSNISVSTNTHLASVPAIISPGTVVTLYIRFSQKVVVIGLIRLILRGGEEGLSVSPVGGMEGSGWGSGPSHLGGNALGSSRCYAEYLSGNNTDILQFSYYATPESGTSRLDCAGIHGFDLTHGSVLRYSSNPIILAATRLNVRGAYGTLGRQTDIVIDISNPTATTVTPVIYTDLLGYPLLHTADDVKPIFPLTSFSLNFDAGNTELKSVLLSDEDSSTVSIYNNISSIISVVPYLSIQPLKITEIYSTKESVYFTAQSTDLSPLLFTPQTGILTHGTFSQSNWQSAYSSQSVLDLTVTYDRAVVPYGAADMYVHPYISLTTSTVLNNAFYTHIENTVLLLIDVSTDVRASGDALVNENGDYAASREEEEQFQLEYGGRATRCIYLSTDTYGILDAIQDVPELKVLGPTVELMNSSDSNSNYDDGQISGNYGAKKVKISFQRPLSFPLNILSPSQSSCLTPFTKNKIRKAVTNTANFRYNIRTSKSVIFTARSFVPPGIYRLRIEGVFVSQWGLDPKSILFERISSDGRVLLITPLNNTGISRLAYSGLEFGSTIPSTSTSVKFLFCLRGRFEGGENVIVKMGTFNLTNLVSFSYIDDSGNTIFWNSTGNSVTLTVNVSTSVQCVSTVIPAEKGLRLPATAIYDNSTAFTVSIVSTENVHVLDGGVFDRVRGVGVGSVSVGFDPPKYGPTAVTINFTLLTALPLNTTVHVRLPNFSLLNTAHTVVTYPQTIEPFSRRLSGKSNSTDYDSRFLPYVPMKITGTNSDLFHGYWGNETEGVVLELLVPLSPGVYSVTFAATEKLSVVLPTVGVSGISPPVISIYTPLFSVQPTQIFSYPRVLGVHDISLLVQVVDIVKRRISRISLSVNFTENIHGSTSLYVTLPFLSCKNALYSSAPSPFLPSGISLKWVEIGKMLTITYPTDFTFMEQKTYTIEIMNSTEGASFSVNEKGIIYPYKTANNTVTLITQNDFPAISVHSLYNGITTSLTDFQITEISVIPVIQYSSIRFSPDIYTDNATITVSLRLNTPALPGDTFSFFLFGIYGPSSQTVKILGPCISSSFGNSVFTRENSTLQIQFLNNSAECAEGLKSFTWIISAKNGISAPQSVLFLNSTEIQVNWYNRYQPITWVKFTDPPTVGFVAAKLSFQFVEKSTYPNSEIKTEMVLRILTSAQLLSGDVISLFLRNINVTLPITGISGLSSSTILEKQSTAKWKVTYDIHSSVLTLTVPTNIDARSLLFEFGVNYGVILPSYGITGDTVSEDFKRNYSSSNFLGNISNSHNGNYLIGLSRGKKFLSRNIIDVQNVGNVLSAVFTPVPQGLLNRALERTVLFRVSLALSGLLNAGDVLSFYAPHYSYHFSANLVILSAQQFVAFVNTDLKSITVSPVISLNSTSFSFTILDNEALTIPTVACTVRTCPIKLSVTSASCPIESHTIFESKGGLISSTSIRIRTVDIVPTFYPTSQPTIQPTSQPSSTPSSQPTSSPTYPSSQPTTRPTSAPSGRPTSIPTSHPTSQPSSAPSGQPTSRPSQPSSLPSSQPSSQPSSRPTLISQRFLLQSGAINPSCGVNSSRSLSDRKLLASSSSFFPSPLPTGQPTSLPSTQLPSSLPSSSPSNTPVHYFLAIDLYFVVEETIVQGTVFSIYIPQISSQVDSFPSMVLSNPIMSITWTGEWHAVNQTLSLTSTRDITGAQSFTMGSLTLLLSDDIIYANDTSVTYSLYDPIFGYTNGGLFNSVAPRGFVSTNLTFGQIYDGRITTLFLYFEAEQIMIFGDKISVFLPNFIGVDKKVLHSNGITSADFTAKWSQNLPGIIFTILKSVKILTFSVSADNGIYSPLESVNNLNGFPTVFLRTHNWQTFGPSAFQISSPLSFLSSSNISYSPSIASQETIIKIQFRVGVQVAQFDHFDISLPSFWSSSYDISVLNNMESSSGSGTFSASWFSCSTILRLTVKNTVSDLFFSVKIGGLRLPINGVDHYSSKAMTISSTTKSAEFASISIQSVQLVPYLNNSHVDILPEGNGKYTAILLTFQYSLNLNVNDTITLTLPGITINNIVEKTDAAFSVSTGTLGQLILIATSPLPHFSSISTLINGTFSIPQNGYPMYDNINGFENNGNGSNQNMTYIQFVSNTNAFIHGNTPISVNTIGFENVKVYYKMANLFNIIQIRFQFQITGVIEIGDFLLFTTPQIWGKNGDLGSVSGDQAEDNFVPKFDVSFDSTEHTFLLTAKYGIPRQEINVFIDTSSNGFSVLSGTDGFSEHLVRGSFSSIGIFGPKIIQADYILNSLPVGIFTPGLLGVQSDMTVSACAPSVPCVFYLDIIVENSLDIGEMLAISHPNFVAPKSLNTSGNGTNYFNTEFRDSDYSNNVNVQGNVSVPTQSTYVRAPGDRTFTTTNLEIPKIKENSIVVVTYVPRVLAIVLTGVSSAIGVGVGVGDVLNVIITFDDLVCVSQNHENDLKFVFNNGESAFYSHGNGTTQIHFVYHIKNPKGITPLSPLGPNALTPYVLYRCGWRGIVANTTLPLPWDFLLHSDGDVSGAYCTALYCTVLYVRDLHACRLAHTRNTSPSYLFVH